MGAESMAAAPPGLAVVLSERGFPPLLPVSEQLPWASGGGCGWESPAGLCSSDTNCARENGSLEWKIVLIYLAEDDNDLLNNRSNFISMPQLL